MENYVHCCHSAAHVQTQTSHALDRKPLKRHHFIFQFARLPPNKKVVFLVHSTRDVTCKVEKQSHQEKASGGWGGGGQEKGLRSKSNEHEIFLETISGHCCHSAAHVQTQTSHALDRKPLKRHHFIFQFARLPPNKKVVFLVHSTRDVTCKVEKQSHQEKASFPTLAITGLGGGVWRSLATIQHAIIMQNSSEKRI